MTLTSLELREEEFLKDADSSEIIDWLRTNSDPATLFGDKFYNFRQKYEPLWVEKGEDKLTLTVCLYGRNVETLKQLLFKDRLPMHFKEAVIENPALLSRPIANYGDEAWISRHQVISADVMALHATKDQNELFFGLFQNTEIDEEFLTEVFTKQSPYDSLSNEDLLNIFQILFASKNRYFSRRKLKYQNSAYRDDARYLANAIIRFIPAINDIGRHAELDAFADPSILFHIRYFLEDTADLDTDGISEEKILALFNIPEPNETRDAQYFAEELPFIQRELASRAFSDVFFDHQKEKLRKLRESSHEVIKSNYYKYADISEIYGLEAWQLDKFFEALSNISGDPFDAQSHEHLEKKEFQTAISSITMLLQENYKFVAALALNKQHYTRKNRRDFLRSICREADVIGNTFPWPLGNGTCVEIFEAQSEKLRDTNPQYFKDESFEKVLITQVEVLSRDVTQIKRQIETPHKELLSAIQRLDSKINEMQQRQKDDIAKIQVLQNQVTEAVNSILPKLAEPRDILSRFLFGLPIIGRIFRALFR